MVTRRLQISGRVQGVGFRYAMQAQAERLGLRGWVRNRRDGRVEALAHGEPAALERLIDWARHGPPGAHVVEVRCSDAAAEPASAFEIRSTV